MEAHTHIKITKLDCFVCCETNVRQIKLNGRKSEVKRFIGKFKVLLNNDNLLSSIVNSESPTICRKCYRKIEHTYGFIIQLKTSATKYVHQSDVRVKRGVTSPLTANTLNPGPLIAKHNRSRKKQTLLSPAKEVRNPNPSSDIPVIEYSIKSSTCTLHADHDYSTPAKQVQNATASDKDHVSNFPVEEHSTQSFTYTLPADHGYIRPVVDDKVSCESPMLIDMKALLQEISAGKDSTSVLLQELRTQSSSLTSRTQIFCSVLHKFRDISRLEDSIDHFTDEIIKEMMKRVPLLLKVILCVATPASKNMKPSILPAIASAYSILMKHKCDNLSAYHRLTTIIAIKGGLDERVSINTINVNC
ncbi:hypothetical protein DPMN_080732 [Dreissena polymorpha]|uniref:ZAD domain-containing protein n=1 Tax=Dreissena polymorpha TaxID=45954 RepID=A0A9D3YV48_DREPO|nr:hypothetical protein DPMN_080732 [Dreissena polymorpha]